MSRIFISTNLDSAQSCFNDTDEDNVKELKVISVLKIKNDLTIQQFEETQVWFHFDKSNPNFQIDFNNDLLLYHSQTDGYNQNNGFIQKFRYKEFRTHPEGTFRRVFEILIDDGIEDKYTAIKTFVFSNLNPQVIGQIGSQFINSGNIDINQIKSLLKSKFNHEIEDLLAKNAEYHTKKATKTNTKDDDNLNLDNWSKLEKALKASNGK